MQLSAAPAAAHEQPQHAENIAHAPCPPGDSDVRQNVPLEGENSLSSMGEDVQAIGVEVGTNGHAQGNHRNGGLPEKAEQEANLQNHPCLPTRSPAGDLIVRLGEQGAGCRSAPLYK